MQRKSKTMTFFGLKIHFNFKNIMRKSLKTPLPYFVTVAAWCYRRATSTAANAKQEDLKTNKRMSWLLGQSSQQKRKLGIISILVVNVIVLLCFLIYIMV